MLARQLSDEDRGDDARAKGDATAYGERIAALLQPPREMELGPGQPHRAAEPRLRALSPESLFAPRQPVDRDMARCCLAGLWLVHDFLEASHSLSQEIQTTAGSYWHAILHRREGDFDNAKYWFRRVTREGPIEEQVWQPLRHFAATTAQPLTALDAALTELVTLPTWDSFRFVDCCARAQRPARPGHEDSVAAAAALCRRIQTHEWQLLFDHCFRAAMGERNATRRGSC